MKKVLAIAVLVSIVCVLSTEMLGAAPLTQQWLYEITSPQPNAQVRGTVEIIGTARLAPEFQYYKVEYASSAAPQDWVTMGDVHRQEKNNDVLEIWHTNALPDGSYYLHLVMVRPNSSMEQTEPLPVKIANTQPTATPVPEETPTPTETIAMPTPTTAIVEQPTVVRSTPISTGQAVATPTTIPEVREGIPVPDLGVYARQFLFGAFVAAALFLLVGVVALLRRLI